MKKLVLFAAVVFSASMFACKSSDAATENVDSAAVVEEVVEVVDSCCADSVVADTVAAAVVAE